MLAGSALAAFPTKEDNFVIFVLFVVETDTFASPLTTIAPFLLLVKLRCCLSLAELCFRQGQPTGEQFRA
jgi:hypothetical protein